MSLHRAHPGMHSSRCVRCGQLMPARVPCLDEGSVISELLAEIPVPVMLRPGSTGTPGKRRKPKSESVPGKRGAA